MNPDSQQGKWLDPIGPHLTQVVILSDCHTVTDRLTVRWSDKTAPTQELGQGHDSLALALALNIWRRDRHAVRHQDAVRQIQYLHWP